MPPACALAPPHTGINAVLPVRHATRLPGLCVARVPKNGRNFEYLSGEDPFLGYHLVQPVIQGIQQNKVVANAKHWVLNNEEHNRQAVSDNADERTRYDVCFFPWSCGLWYERDLCWSSPS